MIPPILPAPRNATFFPAISVAITFLDCLSNRKNHRKQNSHRAKSDVPSDLTSISRSLHPVPGGSDHIEQTARCFPLQQSLSLCGIGHESGRISRTPRHYFSRHRFAGNLLNGGDYFANGGAGPCSELGGKTG